MKDINGNNLHSGDKVKLFVYNKWRKANIIQDDKFVYAKGTDSIGNTDGFQIALLCDGAWKIEKLLLKKEIYQTVFEAAIAVNVDRPAAARIATSASEQLAVADKAKCIIGPYEITPHPPIPKTDQVNVAWICKDGEEGMSLDLDNLWEGF